MADLDPDINLSIPVKAIYDEFFCPICYDIIKQCTMTQCSHNFCKACISECLNRKKKCPCCNAEITMNQLSPNKQFDRLIQIIQVEKERVSKLYFENLINGSNQQMDTENNESRNTQQLSPIEQIFHTHMKRSLLSYEEYFQKIKAKYDARSDQIRQEYTNKMMEHQKNINTGRKAITIYQDNNISKMKSECDVALEEVDQSFKKSIEMLLTSYDEYMKSFAPPPQFLPILITIQVPSKNIQFPNVHINPTDTVEEVKQVICQKMEKKGDSVISFDDTDIVLVNGTDTKEIEITINVPIIQYQPEPGASLILRGHLKCKSDAPKVCFKEIFVPNTSLKMDYFTCKDCKLNWICKSCAELCHNGHSITEYIHNHSPSWACCYCTKTGKCTLFSVK